MSNNQFLKMACIFTTFPCKSEIFAYREVEQLTRSGFDISIFAATSQGTPLMPLNERAVVYRPTVFSMCSFASMTYIFIRYPVGIIRLAKLILKLMLSNPNEAKTILRNSHTIAFWVYTFDKRAIFHIHAYFLNWPSCIAMAIAVISKRTFSIAAHARDVFVERGAIKVKLLYASFLITCCQYTLDYLKRILPPDFHHKLFLNYHGVNLEPYSSPGHASKSVNCNTHRLLFVGRLVPKKGVENLLKAFAAVLMKHPECLLRVAGNGPDFDTLVELAKKLNLRNQIKFLGWQETESIGRLMQSSTVLVVSSTFARDGDRDGVPNVILEAFANSLPVIASRMSGITEAVIHRETGLLVEPGDVEELTNAIEKLLQDAHLREQLAQKAFRLLKDNFDLTKNVQYLANLFMNKRNAASKN